MTNAVAQIACRHCAGTFVPKRRGQVFCTTACCDQFHAKKLIDSGRCRACGGEKDNPERYCKSCLDKYAEGARLEHEHRRRLVIEAYGDLCACCGEREYAFLCIDHINGGGNQHRASIQGDLYSWLCTNGFPPGFQTLCHNCNMAKGLYGACPHTRSN